MICILNLSVLLHFQSIKPLNMVSRIFYNLIITRNREILNRAQAAVKNTELKNTEHE